MADLDDKAAAELDHLLKQGDRHAFTQIYNQFAPELIIYVSRKVLSLDDAHDVLQEVFIHFWSDRGKVTSIRPYLYFVARNKIVDYFRKNATRKEYASLHQLVVEPSQDPMNAIEAKDLRINLEQAIEELAPRTREIFKLSREHNLTTIEIAMKLGLSEQTVKNQLSSALSFLRKRADSLSILLLLCFFGSK